MLHPIEWTLFGLVISVFVAMIVSRIWYIKWFCDKMGWHKAPLEQTFDGCSAGGKCPVCGKSVLQDSQGNWF
jgi:hypothetical protein